MVETTDTGLMALTLLARRQGVATTAALLAHDLALAGRHASSDELLLAATRLGLPARIVRRKGRRFLHDLDGPVMLRLKDGGYAILRKRKDGILHLHDPRAHAGRPLTADEILERWSGEAILVGLKSAAADESRTLGFAWFLDAMRRYRKPFGHVVVASVFVQVFALVTPLLFQVIIDKVLVHKSVTTLYVVTAAMVLIGLFDVTLQYLRSYVVAHTSSRLDVEIGSKLLHRLFSLPLAYFEKRPVGQTIARVRELENIRAFLTGPGLTSGIDTLFAVLLLVAMLAYSATLTGIVVVMVLVNVLTVAVIRPLLRQRIREKFYHGAESHQFLVEAVAGAPTIKAAAIEPLVVRQWEEKLATYVRSAFKVVMLNNVGQNIVLYLNKLTTALILLFGARAAIAGDMTVGGLVAFNMIANQLLAPVVRLSNFWQEFQQVQVSIEKVGDILQAEPERHAGVTHPSHDVVGAISIRHLHFRHVPGGRPTLEDVSLELPAGQVLGIVGPSGSGKSTLAKLLQRLYEPESGQILIDGVDITEVNAAWLRKRVGVVLQENLLFNRTVHENIALNAPWLTRDRVVALARLAGADGFIRALPMGYDTPIVERGANLSGGQRQRIAIARALANDPRILIFDEATSALDYESEQVIQANMAKIAKGRTVVIIAHRLAAVRHCDSIVGMADGRIVEQGSHEELLQRAHSLYARLWNLQAGLAPQEEPA